MVLLNPILGSPVGSWQAGGCESRTSLRPGWLCWSDVPFVARARAGNEVSVKAGLIEAFLLLRSRINKQSCHVLAGFLRFVFSQEASPRKNSLYWSRGLNYSGSTGIPRAPVIRADLTRAVGAISLGLDLLYADLCDSHLLPQLWGHEGS